MISAFLILAGSLAAAQPAPDRATAADRITLRDGSVVLGLVTSAGLGPARFRRAAGPARLGREEPQDLGEEMGPRPRGRLQAGGEAASRTAAGLAARSRRERPRGRPDRRLDRSGAETARAARPARADDAHARASRAGRREEHGPAAPLELSPAPARLALRDPERRDDDAGEPRGRRRGPRIRSRRRRRPVPRGLATAHRRKATCRGWLAGPRRSWRSTPTCGSSAIRTWSCPT